MKRPGETIVRIGLFGGSFNPIHFGHLRVAREVVDRCGLKKMLFVPSAVPPHKPTRHMASAADRQEMVRLAAGLDSTFRVSDVELKRAGRSYTIDTVRHFMDRAGGDQALHLVMGMDAFLEIDTWKAYDDLLQLVPLIVMTRPAGRGDPSPSAGTAIESFMQDRLSAKYRFSPAERCYIHPFRERIYVAEVSALGISGTQIRRLVSEKQSIRFLVPPAVEDYIYAEGLYL